MIKKILYAWCIVMTIAITSCSEDSLSVLDELNSTIYDPVNAESETTEAMINEFYEKYGSKILYDFKASDLYFGWSSSDIKWYVPIKQGESDTYIQRMISFIENDALSEYPVAFTKKFLPYRIFLVDSICDNKEYQENKLTDILELKTHSIAIAHISEDMDNLSDKDWQTISSGINTALLNSIYSAVGVEPTDFNSSSEATFIMEILEDPLQEFTNLEYSCYMATVVNATALYSEDELLYIMKPNTNEDFGYFVSFIMTTAKTRMDRIFERFPKIKNRATLAYQFMLERAETDLIEFQRSSCPNDPLPADYFSR